MMQWRAFPSFPINASRVVIVALIVAPLIGCDASPSDRYSHLTPVDAADALRSAFKSTDQLTFLSWDGVWQGTDVDTEVTLRPDGTATITHCGSGVDSVSGTYCTDGSLVIVSADFTQLVEMPGAEDWPSLRVKRDGDDLLLVPDRNTTALSYAKSNGWPLRRSE